MLLDGSLQEVVNILSKALYGEPMVCLRTVYIAAQCILLLLIKPIGFLFVQVKLQVDAILCTVVGFSVDKLVILLQILAINIAF